MRSRKFVFLFLLFVLSFIPCKAVRAGSIYTSPFVRFSSDGKAWTVEQSLPGYDLTGRPLFWYRPENVNFRTGITSTLRQLKMGEHYYKYDRKGNLPIGQWRVEHVTGMCIHVNYHGEGGNTAEQTYHGLEWNANCCLRPYYSGWIAYCADCGEGINFLIYMSEEAAHTITELPMGVDYYYLCPHCSHLEQGVSLTHRCSAVSYNRYKVEYKKNADDAGGYMSDSFHMYNNAEMLEGRQVTPVKRLSLNSYFRTGYRFLGWNTKADGTGDFYADGEEIFNLTDENYDEAARKGIIILYAQWERIESNLVFDAAGGRYEGENPMRRGYGEILYLEGGLVVPPKGYKVSFQANGGSGILPVESRRSFERWDIMTPMHGSLTGNAYCFMGEMDVTDTAVAVYRLESINLPTPERPGFSFGGWYADEELTRLVGYGGDSYTPDSDVTLYARWVELCLSSADNYTDYGGRGAVDLSWRQPDNTDKVYKLYQSENGGADYVPIADVQTSADQEPDLKTEFLYEENGEKPQTFIVPSSGFYTLTADGAQGGNYGDFLGGLGGRVSGTFYLTKGEALTLTTGGRDGGNGGGKGTVYAGGGGMTQIVSDRRGLLLTAGGGGGAGEAGDGQPGGAGSGLVPEGNAGENGMSGGGGGCLGGVAGEHIIHLHTKECRVKYAEDYIAANKVAVANTDKVDDSMGVHTKRCRSSLIKIEGIKSVSVCFSWFNAWVKPVLSQTMLRIMDQNGRVLREENADQVLNGPAFHNGASLNALLNLCTQYEDYGTYEMWLKRFDAYTFSDLPAEFLIDVTPSEDGYSICRIIAEPVTDGSMNWVHVRMKHLDTGQIYENASGRAYHPDGVRTKVTLDRHSSEIGGYDNWNDNYVDRYMDMKIEYELDESVSGIYVEGSAAVYAPHTLSHFTAALKSVVLQVDRPVCGMAEGQVLSSRPAYGGSSYVNTDLAVSWDMTAGCVEGDGSVEIRAEMINMAEGQELKAVKAHDTAAPPAIAGEMISKTPLDEKRVLVSFFPVEDNGTEYFFRAESYSIRTGRLTGISNVVNNMLKTGLDGYLYLVDRNPDTVVTTSDAADGQNLLREERIVVELEDFVQYLHLAAVDRAGNVSDTVHVRISREDKELYWQPYTELLNVGSTVGGHNYDNLHPAENDRTYYVKADGATPFLLSFDSYMEGAVREDYQINYQILNISYSSGGGSVSQRHIARLPYARPPEAAVSMDGRDFVRRTAGQNVFRDALYGGASRSERGLRVSFYQAFTVEKELSGRVIRVVPAAGAATPDGVLYSRWTEDERNGLWLVADGEGPVITGLEALQSVELIDRTKESITVEMAAADELSGVRDFYLEVENLDNFSNAVYPADENGKVRVAIAGANPLFSGDLLVTAHAADNVGNVTEHNWYVTEFALETKAERILEPHEPVLKRGESGMLYITAWGYVDRVEVEFPDFLSEYSRVIDYGDMTNYRCDEQIEFMIPLYAPEGSYAITVRAYKGDRRLEDYPEIRTIQVKESVLDEIRTRLRE